MNDAEPSSAPNPPADLSSDMEEHRQALDHIEQTMDYGFTDRRLLLEALTHPSHRETADYHYERLEFLGDAVLGLIVGEHLFREFPGSDEGELTRVKSMVVSRAALAQVGRRLGIPDHVILGKGMLGQDSLPRSVVANSTEALIGAVYLDGGMEPARQFVLREMEPRIRRALQAGRSQNYKSLLQQLTQRQGSGTPTYQLLSVTGPDHEKTFEIAAVVENRRFPPSFGASKKIAEQKAAKTALRALESELDEEGATSS